MQRAAPLPRPQVDLRRLAWAAVALVTFTALFAPVMVTAVQQSADFADHVRDARLWAEAGLGLAAANRPHFVFHLATVLVHGLIPGEWWVAGWFVSVAFLVATGVLLYALVQAALGPGRSLWALSISVALMLVGPVTFFTWGSQNLYFGYLPAHTYHNPTQIVLKPLGLAFFLLALHGFAVLPVGWRTTALTFAAGLVSTLAKPSLSICLAPALAVVTLYRLVRRQPVRWDFLIAGVGLPIALVLAWQYLFHRSGLGGFALEPFFVLEQFSPGTWPWKIGLSVLFPAVVYLAYLPDAGRRLDLNLAWLTFGAGAAYVVLLSEPRDWTSGNFLWSAQIGVFVLMVVSALAFMRFNRERQTLDWRTALGAVAFVLHLICGVYWYAVQYSNIYAWW